MARQFFRSSRPPARPKTAPRAWKRTVLALGGAAGAYVLLSPLFQTTSSSLEDHFQVHRADFDQLRDMMISEPSLESVGVENVGDYWLFDGRWTAPGRRFAAYSRAEMLAATGLSAERYQAYLDLLGRARAYRVARQGGGRDSLKGSVFLLPNAGEDPVPGVIVFAERPPEPLLPLAQARRARGPAYARLDDGWYREFNPR
jgi:hypothetical protein